ncbi:MAG: AAA family ATPase, partial [Verrucomicrobiota bacterium]
MADVIKNFLQKSSIRFVGEITEEKLSLLQEIDRSFCDLFEIIRIPELDSDSSLKVIINKQRELETKFGVRFDASIVPLANDLQRRFNRHESRPGSVVAFLSNLASRNSYESIDRSSVIKSFSEQSGFFASFIDHTLTLSQEEIAAGLGKEWIGQEAALQTLAATISTARSGIQDPHKPFGCFLFLGPTGVGKTECAKGLARYLYGSEERLLRYDMNEYVSEHSVSQLYGTYEQPDGYLTSAIQLQPYSIVLFDEIEKAHPDVYDVLLQVLGEGRLSDALGRTVDFTNSIIILTSNLGVRESQKSFGFGAPTADPNAFRTAAQKFFRPEFYNRIDSIIPFRSLTRDEISGIAERLIDSLFKRSGFLQRHACIEISPQAKEWLIDRGYDPIYGARALKRELEQSVSKPVSRMLSKTEPQQPIVLEIDESGDRLLTKVTPLENAAESRAWRPSIKKDNTLKAIEALQEFTSDIERDLPDDLIASSASSPSIFDHDDPYYDDHPVGASEELRHLKTKLTELQFELEEDRLRRLSHGLRRQTANIHYDKWGNKPLNIRDLFAIDDFNLFLDQLFENHSPYSTQPNEASNERSLQSALQEAILLGLRCDASAPIETALIIESRDFPKHIHPRPLQSGIEYLNQDSEDPYIASICRGRNLRALLKHAEGTCLNIDATSGAVTPLQLKTRFLDPEQSPQEQAAALLRETRPCGPFLPVTLIQRRLQNG